MAINRYSLYDEKFDDFLSFWNTEIEKKLFRCCKECGVFNEVKKSLNPKSKSNWDANLYFLYRNLKEELECNKTYIIDFSNENSKLVINRRYCVNTALNDKRHFSQLLIYYILKQSKLTPNSLEEVFAAMDKELYKGHRMKNFFYEKWGFVKLFFS